MATTVDSLVNRVFSLLAETTGSPAGSLYDASGTEIETTPDAVKRYLTEAGNEVARSCYPIHGSGEVAWAAHTASKAFSAITPAVTGQPLWAIRAVRYGGAALAYTTLDVLETYFPLITQSEGTPRYWYQMGETLSLNPVPAVGQTLEATGLVLPPVVASADLSWGPDDLLDALSKRAAVLLALRNAQDPSLVERAGIWQKEYDETRMAHWLAIPPMIQRAHYPAAPKRG